MMNAAFFAMLGALIFFVMGFTSALPRWGGGGPSDETIMWYLRIACVLLVVALGLFAYQALFA
jgi:hypothetical protein